MAVGLAAAWSLGPFPTRPHRHSAWREAARRIGSQHLRALRAGSGHGAQLNVVPVPTNVSALRRRIADDYANGRTGHVNGWVLSRTELALCLQEATV